MNENTDLIFRLIVFVYIYICVYFILLTAYGYVLSSYYVFYNYIRLCVVTCFFENCIV